MDGAFMKWLLLKIGWYRTGLYKIDIICFVASNHHNSTIIFFTEKKKLDSESLETFSCRTLFAYTERKVR